LKVATLRESLDEHLRANQTSLATRSSNSTNLAGYFDKIGSSSRSPTKRVSAPEKLQDTVTSGDEDSAPKKGRRKTVQPAIEELVDQTRDSAFLINTHRAANTVTDLVKTPAKELSEALSGPRRSSILASPGNLDTSPRAVVEYLDRNTRKVSSYISDGISKTHISEYSDVLRDWASSPLSVTVLGVAVDLYAVLRQLIELRDAFKFTVPWFGTYVPVKAPDAFALITPDFWAPFSLFFLSTIFFPAAISYFINFPQKSASTHHYSTRRATAQHDATPLLDPLVFNIARGLIAYLVFTVGTAGVWPYAAASVGTVNTALYFGSSGIITSAVIGATVSLYEAVLKK
jgi:hypothetical protein